MCCLNALSCKIQHILYGTFMLFPHDDFKAHKDTEARGMTSQQEMGSSKEHVNAPGYV